MEKVVDHLPRFLRDQDKTIPGGCCGWCIRRVARSPEHGEVEYARFNRHEHTVAWVGDRNGATCFPATGGLMAHLTAYALGPGCVATSVLESGEDGPELDADPRR